MIKIQPVSFPSVGSHPERLEGLFYHTGIEGQRPAAVVCHPHPLGGGSMHNNVTDHFFRGFERQVGEEVARFLSGL